MRLEEYTQYIFILGAEIKDYNVVIDGRNFSINQEARILEHMITFKKLQLVK